MKEIYIDNFQLVTNSLSWNMRFLQTTTASFVYVIFKIIQHLSDQDHIYCV